MKKSGYADLPLHGGRVPQWLSERMSKLGGAIIETLVIEYGRDEVLRRLSDPNWFQSFGCVLGMDWHSSGITTSVMGALKSAINPISRELGIYICGGRGRHSKKTPEELLRIADHTGLDGEELVKSSRLTAKVDSTAIQDGYQVYLHSFVLTKEGKWAVIQQGMNQHNGYARRYHWHSPSIKSFINEPHTSIAGINHGEILNLTDSKAKKSRAAILEITKEHPIAMLQEIQKIRLPSHHDVRQKDVDIRRLGAVLETSNELSINKFENLLLLKGLGPRTLQSLALVSEVIYGTPNRFTDPARFSFAHGGKDGHPFPVPTKIYDESINVLKTSIEKSKIGHSKKIKALKSLHQVTINNEQSFQPKGNLDDLIEEERKNSWKYGGRTVFGKSKPPKVIQGSLF